jgi:hypothetical protein
VRSETFLRGKLVAAPLRIDAELARVAQRQHGLVTVAQLRAMGLTDGAITKRVNRDVLHRRYRGVYALGHASLSREGEWLAAVLAAGDGAALSHGSAAELHAISRFRNPRTAVVTRRKRRIEGVRVYTTRHLHARDLTTYERIPVTSVPRTLVDLSDVLTPHQLANVIHEAAFKGRFSELATRDAMARANGRHKLRVLERALALHRDGSAGTRSGGEDAFLALPATIPEPRVNTELCGFEVDFHWPGLKLAVEIDGPGHGRPRTRREDVAKAAALAAAGYALLRFTDEDVHQRPRRVLAAIEQTPAASGAANAGARRRSMPAGGTPRPAR